MLDRESEPGRVAPVDVACGWRSGAKRLWASTGLTQPEGRKGDRLLYLEK